MLTRIALVLGLAAAAACMQSSESRADDGRVAHPMRTQKPSDDVLRKELTPLQYDVTQHEGTERAVPQRVLRQPRRRHLRRHRHRRAAVQLDEQVRLGHRLAVFWQPISKGVVVERTDDSLGVTRTEVRSKLADSHLGHVFDDGPAPTHLRYCINSASLRFVPVADLAREGYGQFASLFSQK